MGIMAHELRTPLATMQLIGEAMRNEAAQPDGEAGERWTSWRSACTPWCAT
jgi:signal transduction histidine kinase